MELVIDGWRYSGTFRAKIVNGKLWRGSEYTEACYDGYWYEGTGFIVDKRTNERRIFSFRTRSFEKHTPRNNYSLQESIVYFNQKKPFFRPVVVDGYYKNIVDLSLGDMILQAGESDSDIPEVEPKELNLDDLVESGFCVGKTGQISIPY